MSGMSPLTLVSHPTHFSWSHVAISFTFVVFSSAISQVLRLDVGALLAIAALRCMAQLIVVAFILRHIFAVESMWRVVRLSCMFNSIVTRASLTVIHPVLLNALGTYEIGTPFGMQLRPHVTHALISHQCRETMSVDGACLTWGVHETFDLLSPFLSLSSFRSCS